MGSPGSTSGSAAGTEAQCQLFADPAQSTGAPRTPWSPLAQSPDPTVGLPVADRQPELGLLGRVWRSVSMFGASCRTRPRKAGQLAAVPSIRRPKLPNVTGSWLLFTIPSCRNWLGAEKTNRQTEAVHPYWPAHPCTSESAGQSASFSSAPSAEPCVHVSNNYFRVYSVPATGLLAPLQWAVSKVVLSQSSASTWTLSVTRGIAPLLYSGSSLATGCGSTADAAKVSTHPLRTKPLLATRW